MIRAPSPTVFGVFMEAVAAMAEDLRVLEVGTLRSEPERPTHHRSWVPHAASFVGLDIAPGPDVDVVGDVEDLPLNSNSIDVAIACSVFEHVRRPWVGAAEMVRVVRPGGLIYVQTHQTFPIHAYPSDYFRFSREALESLLLDAGVSSVVSEYDFPCKVVPIAVLDEWNLAAEAFLNVAVVATV